MTPEINWFPDQIMGVPWPACSMCGTDLIARIGMGWYCPKLHDAALGLMDAARSEKPYATSGDGL